MNQKEHLLAPASLLILALIAVAVFFLTQSGGNEISHAFVPEEGEITCTISAEKTEYAVGESPEIKVTLHNKTGQEIVLVGSLDASDLGWRYPICDFKIEGPPDHSVNGIGRCGNTNPLRLKDFITVPAGGKFDPYMKVDDYGFFATSDLMWHNFSIPGKYRIKFRYSTDSREMQKWNGFENANGFLDAAALRERFRQVPRFTVESNTIELTFAPPPGGFVPGFQTPMSQARNLGTNFLYRHFAKSPLHPSKLDIVWIVDGLPAELTPDRLVGELSTLDINLSGVAAPVVSEGGRWINRVVTLDPSPKQVTQWEVGDISSGQNEIRNLKTKAVSQENLFSGIQSAVMQNYMNISEKDHELAVFVITEKPITKADAALLVPEGAEENPAIFRVTRKTGTWIPELLIGSLED